MKTLKLNILFIFIALAQISMAQISIGLKSGYTKAWQEYGEVDLPEDAVIHIEAWHTAILVDYKLNKFLGLTAEPGYSKRGAACEPGFVNFNSDTKLVLHYLDFPVFLKLSAPIPSNKFDCFAKLGFGTSMAVSAYRDVTNFFTNEVERNKIDLDGENGINKWDYGFYGGIGIAHNFGLHKIFVETSIYNGLIDVDSLNRSENRNLNFSLGYQVQL